MGARNRVGIGFSYRPAKIHSWQSRFLGSLNVLKYCLSLSKCSFSPRTKKTKDGAECRRCNKNEIIWQIFCDKNICSAGGCLDCDAGGSLGACRGHLQVNQKKKKIFEKLFAKTCCRSGQKTLNFKKQLLEARARIFLLLRSQKIDFKEPIPPGCVAWRAGTTTLFLLGFLASTDCFKNSSTGTFESSSFMPIANLFNTK
jgi:hypothetical protein